MTNHTPNNPEGSQNAAELQQLEAMLNADAMARQAEAGTDAFELKIAAKVHEALIAERSPTPEQSHHLHLAGTERARRVQRHSRVRTWYALAAGVLLCATLSVAYFNSISPNQPSDTTTLTYEDFETDFLAALASLDTSATTTPATTAQTTDEYTLAITDAYADDITGVQDDLATLELSLSLDSLWGTEVLDSLNTQYTGPDSQGGSG